MRQIIFTLLITITQLMAVQSKALDANEIRAYFLDDGGFATHPNRGEGPGLYWPKSADESEGKALIYAAGLWVVGKQNGEIAGSVSQYSSSFRRGYVASWDDKLNEPIHGGENELLTGTNRKVYRLYKIHRDPITGLGMTSSDLGSGHPDEFDYDDWKQNIADGNSRFPSDGKGNPLLIGDQTLFVIYTDAGGPKSHFQKRNSGLEIHQLTWAYDGQAALSRSLFIKFKIFNKSPYNLTDTYISAWDDADIGEMVDDAAGAIVSQSAKFSYNFDATDSIYGDNPPAVLTSILQGPVVKGINPKTNTPSNIIQSGIVKFEKPKGYILRNGESIFKEDSYLLEMTNHNHTYFDGRTSTLNLPFSIYGAYDLMRTRLETNGSQILDPTNNNQVSLITYSGNPFTGEGWLDPIGHDTRQTASVGPINLKANDEQELIISITVGQGPKGKNEGVTNPNIISIQHAKFNNLILKDLFRNDFRFVYSNSNKDVSEPTTFTLHQNYPNPFNPSTNISFSLDKASKVKVTIFNSLGQKVKQLVDQQYSAGLHTVKWNGTNRQNQLVSAGVYFYQIENGKLVRTRKMVLSK